MNEAYLAVAGRIRRELEQIEGVVDRAQDIWEGVDLVVQRTIASTP